MSLFITITYLVCLFIGSRFSDDGCRLLVLDRPDSGIENFDPVTSWSLLLQEMESVSDIIIIERRESTCGASVEEVPNDIIEVSSGIFQEHVTIDESELVIFGLPGTAGNRMVLIFPGRIVTRITLIATGNRQKVTNICLEHFSEKGFRVCPGSGYDQSATGIEFSLVRDELSGGEVRYVCDMPLGMRRSDQVRIYQSHKIQKEAPFQNLPKTKNLRQ